jgi:hypothetical protein
MCLGLVAMSGVQNQGLMKPGLTLPGFIEHNKVIKQISYRMPYYSKDKPC